MFCKHFYFKLTSGLSTLRNYTHNGFMCLSRINNFNKPWWLWFKAPGIMSETSLQRPRDHVI